MLDPLADTTARLERLVEQAMKETDPDKSDELCAEIWRVLREWIKTEVQIESLVIPVAWTELYPCLLREFLKNSRRTAADRIRITFPMKLNVTKRLLLGSRDFR